MDVSLEIYVAFFIISRNFDYFLMDVGRIVKRRTMAYEKIWIKRVEWVGGRHG